MAKKRAKDGTAIDIQSLEAEKNRLYISGDNPRRLKEVKAIIDYYFYGIK